MTSLEKVKGRIAGNERGNQVSFFFLLPILFVVSETAKLNKPGGKVITYFWCMTALRTEGKVQTVVHTADALLA